MEFLDELERQVEAVRKKVAALKRQNRSLASGPAGKDGPAGEAPEWARQREDLRRRIARLADKLDALS